MCYCLVYVMFFYKTLLNLMTKLNTLVSTFIQTFFNSMGDIVKGIVPQFCINILNLVGKLYNYLSLFIKPLTNKVNPLNKPSVNLNPSLNRNYLTSNLVTLTYQSDITSQPYTVYRFFKSLSKYFYEYYSQVFGPGYLYIQGFVFLLFIDSCLIDDEPLWEPIEWSLVQTWILFIFLFGWIAENLIVSRYGSYVGRDKRVWMAWFKTFWLIEMYYVVNFLAAAVFVIVPFYFEVNYSLAFIYSWWHWFSRVFFFKLLSIFSLVLIIGYILQKYIQWLNWRTVLVLVILVNIFFSYLLYTHFIMSFFGYFTNPLWYQKNRPVDYIQLSHEPHKWSWGNAKKRDHYSYHNSKTVFWFKNDGPMASALLLFHLYLFLSLFLVYIYWITLFRRIYSTNEVPLTYTTYCISSLKQLFYGFIMLYFFVFLSFVTQYWRLPIELHWGLDNYSWLSNFSSILLGYPYFLLSILS